MENIVEFNIKEYEKQIELNTYIEDLILKYNDVQYRNNRYLKGCNMNIKIYLERMRKYESTEVDDKDQYIRLEVFKATCKKSIDILKNKIKEAEEKALYELEGLKQQIISILNDGFVNGILHESTLIIKDNFTIYNVPSAKLRFKRLEPVIYDKKELKLYLLECNLEEEYLKDGDINWEVLKNDLEICEDNTIYLKEYGLLMNHNGIKLSDPEMFIKFL